jgi:hypothetical protein
MLYIPSARHVSRRLAFLISLAALATATLHNFDPNNDGSSPMGLVRAIDGRVYGYAQSGGRYGFGTVFSSAFGLEPSVLEKWCTVVSAPPASIPLDVEYASADDGARVIQYTPYGGTNQQWLLCRVE